MNPFDKHIPSVFSICSPFQALCTIAAIRQLEIDDYKVLVWLPRNDIRNIQVENFLRQNEIDYKAIRHINRISVRYYQIKPLIHRKKRYKRLFVGDFRNVMNCCVGCGAVSDRSEIVYLDDGNITISQLRDRDTEPLDAATIKMLDKISKRRGFVFNKNLLTIYDDIPNEKYNIKGLEFSKVLRNQISNNPNAVYIVGTNLERYCGPLEIPEESFISYLDQLMISLKNENPDKTVIYVAHGCETKKYAEYLCEKNGVRFVKPSTMVEMELMSSPDTPETIYGFTSTALFTLKKLFPNARVVNVVFESHISNAYYMDIVDCSQYYSENGIETINIHL